MARDEPQGAYGFRVQGIEGNGALALRGVGSWPEIRFEQQLTSEPGPPGAKVTDEMAWIQTPAAHLTVDRRRRSVTVRAPAPVPDSDLVHPGLWPAAAVFARWLDMETLHGGAFLDDAGKAWCVLGERGAGKSAFLANLAMTGRQIVVDDLLVVRGRECFGGPRCIDLRPETAEYLELGAQTTPVRSTERLRISLEPCDASFELRGFVYLGWAEELEVSRLDPAEALGMVTEHRRVAVLGADVQHLLDLAGLPALRLVRPKAWELEDAQNALFSGISEVLSGADSRSLD